MKDNYYHFKLVFDGEYRKEYHDIRKYQAYENGIKDEDKAKIKSFNNKRCNNQDDVIIIIIFLSKLFLRKQADSQHNVKDDEYEDSDRHNNNTGKENNKNEYNNNKYANIEENNNETNGKGSHGNLVYTFEETCIIKEILEISNIKPLDFVISIEEKNQ